ncbi:hypothetical protein IPL68_00580 [Candidatus Saccharibacteria bacterium]|nr:MAG: hypothetical protein IPL68_00580 [Candidatus Saccharibacteria bacterium]
MARQVDDVEVVGRKERRSTRGSRTIIRQGGGNTVYSMGMIGALVYYMSTADGFWSVIAGIFKALVWPAFLIYHALKSLGA